MAVAPQVGLSGGVRDARPLSWILRRVADRVVVARTSFLLAWCKPCSSPVERVERSELLPSQAQLLVANSGKAANVRPDVGDSEHVELLRADNRRS